MLTPKIIYENLIIFVQVRIENVLDVFFLRHSVVVLW